MKHLVFALLAGCGRVAFDPFVDAADADDAAIDAPDPTCVGTAACYQFDDDAQDASGNGNHASPTAASFDTGQHGGALVVGAGSDVRAPDSASLSITDVLTVDAWVRVDALPPAGERAVIMDHDSSYILWVAADGRLHATLHQANASNDLASVTPGLFPLGQWRHVVMTYDGAMLTSYMNGAVLGSKPATGPIEPDANVDGMRIGGNLPDAGNPANDPFVGAIDQLRIWNRVLPPNQLCPLASC